MTRHRTVAVCACLVAVLGCGAEMKSDFTTSPAVKTQSAYPQAAAEAASTAGSTEETPRSRSATETGCVETQDRIPRGH